ncbi:MAG: hypothetical protein PHV59_07545 [Victivallales bacterium]|nr:hypothetical protein [Victivallales bacterium]
MNTRIHLLLLTVFLTGLSYTACAQLAMSLKMNRSHYLQYETIYTKISIRNNSGHALVFGNDKRLQGKLLFKIIDNKHSPISPVNENSYPMEGTIINPGESKEFVIPVSDYYDLKKCGTYRIYAYIEHNMFEDVYRSNETVFEINQGVTIWSSTVGIPEFMNPKEKTKVKNRTYRIVTLIMGSQKNNYLVIEDKQRIYSVLFLSQELGEERIAHEIDHISRLHLLVPVTPKIFIYLIIDVSGQIDEETVYKRTQTVPALVRNPENGKVYVTGGDRAQKKVDYR